MFQCSNVFLCCDEIIFIQIILGLNLSSTALCIYFGQFLKSEARGGLGDHGLTPRGDTISPAAWAERETPAEWRTESQIGNLRFNNTPSRLAKLLARSFLFLGWRNADKRHGEFKTPPPDCHAQNQLLAIFTFQRTYALQGKTYAISCQMTF